MMPQESGISPPAPLTTPRLAAHSPIRYTKVLFSAQTPKSSDNKMLHAYIIFQSFFKHPPKPHVLHPNTYSRPILTPSSSHQTRTLDQSVDNLHTSKHVLSPYPQAMRPTCHRLRISSTKRRGRHIVPICRPRLPSLLSDSNQRPRDYKSRALAN